MVEFINQLTGTAMYVAEERAAEYAAAGHKQVARILPQPLRLKSPNRPQGQSKVRCRHALR